MRIEPTLWTAARRVAAGGGIAFAVTCLLVAAPAGAAEVRSFRMNSRSAFLTGTLDGIGVDVLGTLQLADRVERLAAVGEPFVFAAARHPRGWVLGTGNAGRVLLVDEKGEVTTLFEAPEPEIFAVWSDPDGVVFAGSSPGGKVYRIAGREAEVFFDPHETYVWGLARAPGGELLVATGTDGKLYRVDGNGTGEVIYDSEDPHLRALKVLRDGSILLGTAGEGLVLRLAADGTARTLYDAPQPEVVAFAEGPDGECYAAVLASEASLVDLTSAAAGQETKQGEAQASGDAGGSVEVTVTADTESAALIGSRPTAYKGPRSEVLRISPDAVVESLSTFEEDTIYALAWQRGRLWVGTGLEGKLFSFQKDKMVLEKDVDERQIVALVSDDPGPAFATTNASAFYRVSAERERHGVYTSPALDAGQPSRFGNLRWQGVEPRGTTMRFSLRVGMSSEPDRTWSPWSEPAAGREVPLADLGSARYVQWRAEFGAADGRSPTLSEVTISYRQVNLAPRILSLSVLDPGQILVPAAFNPASQVYEPAHPNREGIFTTVGSSDDESDARLKTVWKGGYRTLRWAADDPNVDSLRYQLWFRSEGSDKWLPMQDDLEENYYSFDAASLPDGLYRFRLQAFDRPRADDPERLADEEVSEPVLVDHTPPVLVKVDRGGERWSVEVEDALSPLRAAEVSVDADEWRPATVADGLLDGQRETLQLAPAAPGQLVLLRITDAAFNLVTFDVSLGGR